MMLVEIFLIGLLINICHCQGEEHLPTNNEALNPHSFLVLGDKPSPREKFSTSDDLIFTHVPISPSNQYVNHHSPFGVKSLEQSSGPLQLNYFTPNDQLPSRNLASVPANTLIENSYQTSQRIPLPNSYSINPLPYFFLPPKPTPGPPFYHQPKYSRLYLTLYTKPHSRTTPDYLVLKMTSSLNLKPLFNNIYAQRGGPNQISRYEYFYRPVAMNHPIHQKHDAANSEQVFRNKFVELNNQAYPGRHNSGFAQPINPFSMKINQSNNRAKKHVSFHSHSNSVSNKSSIEHCPGCEGLMTVYSTSKPDSVFSSINLTSTTENIVSSSNGTMMVFNSTDKEMLSGQNNSTLNECTQMNSTDEGLASTEKIISTASDLNYGEKISADDILETNNKTSEAKSSMEVIVVIDKNNSTFD